MLIQTKKTLYNLLICLSLCNLQAYAQELQPEWFSMIKGPDREFKQLIEPDNQGNVFVTGVITLYDQITGKEDGYIDTVKIKRYNNLNQTVYVAKLDKNGKVLFHKTLVEQGYAVPKDIEMDKDGNIYVLLDFKGILYLNNNLVRSFNWENTNLALVKFNSDGEYMWHKTYLAPAEIYAEKLDISYNNEVTVLCNINEYSGVYDVTIGGLPFVFEGNFLLVRFDEAGAVLWMRNLITYPASATLSMRYHRVVDFFTDEKGFTYMCGIYEDAIYFSENDSLYTDKNWSVFLVKYSPSNSVEWVKGFENPDDNALVPLSLFRRGETVGVAVLNHSAGTPFTEEGYTLSSYTIGLEYSADGTLLKAYDFYTANSVIIDVAHDNNGNVYLFGGLTANEVFKYGDINVKFPESKWLLIKYSQDKIEWAQLLGDSGFGTDLEVDNLGDIYWSGAWACTTKIFGKTFIAENCGSQRSDALISKLSSKAIYFEPNRLCSDNPITFNFNYYDFYTSSTITDFKVTIENQQYTNPNFSHVFETGGVKVINLFIKDDLQRAYTREYKVDLFELTPEIYFKDGVLSSKTYNNIPTYSWMKDNKLVATTNMPQLKITEPGLYYLQVKAQNDCIFTSNEIDVKDVDIITSVEERKLSDYSVWPNPATNTLFINSFNTQSQISIIALDGRTILTTRIDGQGQINVSELPKGIYIMKCNFENATIYKRIHLN
jgi:hypothetical protein